jgi:hypothetical protein
LWRGLWRGLWRYRGLHGLWCGLGCCHLLGLGCYRNKVGKSKIRSKSQRLKPIERQRPYLVIFFLTETRNLHESQFNKQSLI